MKRFRLAAVLRARQAREDAARATVSRARGAARDAEREVEQRGDQLRRRATPTDPSTVRSYLAASSARSALAAELAAANRIAAEAREEVAHRLEEYTEAAKERRIVEKLAERHAAEQAAAELAAEQKATDEIASSRKPGPTLPMSPADRKDADRPPGP